MPETIKTSERGTVEILSENGGKIIRRTVNAEMPLYAALKNSECKYLPKIYSAEIANGKTVVTEEFIEGKTLLAANPDEKKTVRAMVQLCAALEFIHGLGIVHRDIKPSNILLAEDGNIRLIDFEAARFVRDDKDKDTRYLGTDGFAPPEQYGFSQTDFRADIYAAGQTMKTLLGSLSADKKYAKIIKKATALDPAERYQSAKEFANALADKRGKFFAAATLAVIAAAAFFAVFIPEKIPEKNISDGTAADESTLPPDWSVPAEVQSNIDKYNAELAAGLTYYGVPENLPEYDRADLLFFPEDGDAKILFTSGKALFAEREKFYMYYDMDGDGVNEAIMAEADSSGRLDVMITYGLPDEEEGAYMGTRCFWSEYLNDYDYISIDENCFLQITCFEQPYDGKYTAVTVGDGENFNVTEVYAVKNGMVEYVGGGWGETTAVIYNAGMHIYFEDGSQNTYSLFDGVLSPIAEYDYEEYNKIKNGEYSLEELHEIIAGRPEGY